MFVSKMYRKGRSGSTWRSSDLHDVPCLVRWRQTWCHEGTDEACRRCLRGSEWRTRQQWRQLLTSTPSSSSSFSSLSQSVTWRQLTAATAYVECSRQHCAASTSPSVLGNVERQTACRSCGVLITLRRPSSVRRGGRGRAAGRLAGPAGARRGGGPTGRRVDGWTSTRRSAARRPSTPSPSWDSSRQPRHHHVTCLRHRWRHWRRRWCGDVSTVWGGEDS